MGSSEIKSISPLRSQRAFYRYAYHREEAFQARGRPAGGAARRWQPRHCNAAEPGAPAGAGHGGALLASLWAAFSEWKFPLIKHKNKISCNLCGHGFKGKTKGFFQEKALPCLWTALRALLLRATRSAAEDGGWQHGGRGARRVRLGEIVLVDEGLIFSWFRSVSVINDRRRGSLERTRREKKRALR